MILRIDARLSAFPQLLNAQRCCPPCHVPFIQEAHVKARNPNCIGELFLTAANLS